MRIDTTLMRLGGVAVAAAVVTALAPAVAAQADPSPSPTTTTAPTTTAPTTTSAAVTPALTPSATPSVTPSSPTATTPGAATAAASPSAPRRARAAAPASAPKAAAWLVTQLTGGDHLTDTYAGTVYADYGGTADVAIALASTGTQDATLVKVVRYLEANVDGYADPKGTEGGPYSGSLGKLAVVAEITGQDPHDFGGYDLLGLLTSNVCTAAVAGDYSPCTAAGDFENASSPVSQALDVLALERGGVTVPPTALARLLSLQCADGGFAGTLITAGQACTSDVDSTGYAEQALALDTAASAQVLAASQYLLAGQLADGGWYGASSVSATDANANSTALAVEALLSAPTAAGASAVTAGQALLGSLQHADGALEISPATTPATDNVLATDQSVPAVAGMTLTTLVHPVSLAVTTASPTPTTTTSTVAPTSATVSPTTPVATISNGPAPTAGGTLPFTGTDAALWSQLAVLLLVLGAGFVVAGRVLRRRGAHR
jgi:hypothetical protein